MIIEPWGEPSDTLIQGLNVEYAKIGLEVFNAFSDDIHSGIEKFIEERHEKKMNESGGW